MATKIIYDQDTMKQMALFESITHAKLKDFYDDPVQERLVFIVLPGELWRALGKGSANVKRLENAFKRKIKIAELRTTKAQRPYDECSISVIPVCMVMIGMAVMHKEMHPDTYANQ